jgi:uncharacterized protein YaaQ
MKLLLIIIANDDANKVLNALLKEQYFVTKMASTGGLLSSGNTTLLVGTEEEKIQNAIDIIAKYSKTRKKTLPTNNANEYGIFSSFPVEVNISGATIVVLNVESFMKY